MSEGGHHHGGDMGGQQGFSDPGFQPGMFPSSEPHRDVPDPFASGPPPYARRRYGGRRYRPRVGSPGWVVLWVVRLAIVGFFIYVALQIFHGANSTPGY